MTTEVEIVVPTIGRESLHRLLQALDAEVGAEPVAPAWWSSTIVATPAPSSSCRTSSTWSRRSSSPEGADLLRARNAGWQRTASEWVVLLDDDVVPRPGWFAALQADLAQAPADVAAVQGRVHVPLPADRRPNDNERKVAELAIASWITADMAVRSEALAEVGGFDERFRRAYREDTDLALRLMDAGWRLEFGGRTIDHPVRPSTWWAPVREQRGNADDALMGRLHGPSWRRRGRSPRGMLREHVTATAALVLATSAHVVGRPRLAGVAALTWFGLWQRLWRRRRTSGVDRPLDLVALAISSAAIAPSATFWAWWGRRRARRLAPRGRDDRWRARPLHTGPIDRDGSHVVDRLRRGDAGADGRHQQVG